MQEWRRRSSQSRGSVNEDGIGDEDIPAVPVLDELVCSALHQWQINCGGGGDLEVTEECWGLIMHSMALLVGRAANEGNQKVGRFWRHMLATNFQHNFHSKHHRVEWRGGYGCGLFAVVVGEEESEACSQDLKLQDREGRSTYMWLG